MLQGSVLVPLLWNFVYDGLLKALDLIKDVDAITFADNLALIIPMREPQEIGDRFRGLVRLVTDWCRNTGLRLAREKSEVILLTGKRVPKIVNLDVGGGKIGGAGAYVHGVQVSVARGTVRGYGQYAHTYQGDAPVEMT